MILMGMGRTSPYLSLPPLLLLLLLLLVAAVTAALGVLLLAHALLLQRLPEKACRAHLVANIHWRLQRAGAQPPLCRCGSEQWLLRST
jgi:hypothetical protein